MPLLSLIYVSSAVKLFAPADLVTLLETSRRNNAQSGITGMLLYKEGNFMQALEGEVSAIEQTHAKIQRDPRHQGLMTLLAKPVAERQFPEWKMGFQNLADPRLRGTPGYSEFLNVSLAAEEWMTEPTRIQKLLLMFRQKM